MNESLSDEERRQVEKIAQRLATVIDKSLPGDGPPDLVQGAYDALLTQLVRQRHKKVIEARRNHPRTILETRSFRSLEDDIWRLN